MVECRVAGMRIAREYVCACLFSFPKGSVLFRHSRARSLSLLFRPDHHLAAMANILDPSALIARLANVLPTTKLSLQSPTEGLAALAHTIMSVLSFRLIAVDDHSASRTFENNVLPDEWNLHGPGSFTFRYKHEQSSLEFLLKVTKLGSRTVLNAIALEVRKHLDVPLHCAYMYL